MEMCSDFFKENLKEKDLLDDFVVGAKMMYKKDSVRINVILRGVRVTIVPVEKQ
jgi:hypothetical protein